MAATWSGGVGVLAAGLVLAAGTVVIVLIAVVEWATEAVRSGYEDD